MSATGETIAPWLDHALRYADAGFYTFPLHAMANGLCTCLDPECVSPGKHPLTTHGVKDATLDHTVLASWARQHPVSNIGMAMRDGLIAIDIDPRNGGDTSFDEIQKRFGKFPDTVMALTGGNGFHYLFRNTEKKILAGQLRKGIDIKGEGGYIVVEPSNHASGMSYRWEGTSDPLEGVEIATLPEWMGRDAESGGKKSQDAAVITGATGFIPVKQALEIRSALNALDYDSYDVWLKVGMCLHSTGAPNAFALWGEWAQLSTKYNAPEQRKKWNSFKSGGLHVESIFAMAMAAGWANPGSSSAITEPRRGNPAERFTPEQQAWVDGANDPQIWTPNEPEKDIVADAFPVRILNDLAEWIESRHALHHPRVTQMAVLTIAATIAARKYIGEGGSPAHVCLGLVAESNLLTSYARDAVVTALDDAGFRRMVRGTRATSSTNIYQSAFRTPAFVHVVPDFGYLAGFASRQTSGALDQMFAAMSDAYSAPAIFLDSAADAGIKVSGDDQLVITAPSMTALLLSTNEQMAVLMQRGQMARGMLAHQLPAIVDTAHVVQRDAVSSDPLPIAIRDRMHQVRRIATTPGNKSAAEIFGSQPNEKPALIRVRFASNFAEYDALISAVSTELTHRAFIIAAKSTARRLATTLGAWHNPNDPEATREILEWVTQFVIRLAREWIDRYNTLGNEEGRTDVAQKVVAAIADRKTAGIPRSEVHMYCRSFRLIRDKEKRSKLIDGLLEDGDIVELTVAGERKKTLVAARFAKRVAVAVKA